jgi:diguanylate cyclase
MLRDDLIALGLRTARLSTSAAPLPDPTASGDPLRAGVERLLTLLRDVVAVIDLADDGTLSKRIEECRTAVAVAADLPTINASIDACQDTCRDALSKIDRQRLEQKKEIAALVEMVREALAIVAGDGQSFNQHLDHSMNRFEALVQLDDVRQLKAKLVHEVAARRQIATDRQKAFDATCEKFGRRVHVLERQLMITREKAALDPLTRIVNRGGFDRACRRWKNEQTQFVMVMLDIDDFKTVNDQHGHGAGDRALVAVAHTLTSAVRQGLDVVARLGGDEFAMLIGDLTLSQADNRLRGLASRIAAVNFETPTGTPFHLTISAGIAEFSAGDTLESLMERADSALYDAKHLGKNRIVTRATPTLRDLMTH